MKKAYPYFILVIIISLILSFKFLFFPSERSKISDNGKNVKKAIPVSIFVVGEASLKDHVYASGTIIANEEAELKAEASGTITYIHLPEGKFVRAGTLLLKVNDADLRAQLDKLNIQLKLAEQNELRQRKLLQINGVSQQEYDIIRANLYSLKADSAFHQAQITKTEIRAPFDGVIGIRNVSLGSYLTPAITVAQIHQIDPVKIDFTLPEKYSSLFKEGESIHFKTEGSVKDYTANIFVKDPKVDINSRSVRYRARTNNQDKQLSPGAFVRIELSLNDNRSALFVTTEAVIPVLKGKKVYVIKDGLAEERMVETGLRTEDHVQILSGLVAGDSVAVNGNFQLKQGSSVKVVGSSQQ